MNILLQQIGSQPLHTVAHFNQLLTDLATRYELVDYYMMLTMIDQQTSPGSDQRAVRLRMHGSMRE